MAGGGENAVVYYECHRAWHKERGSSAVPSSTSDLETPGLESAWEAGGLEPYDLFFSPATSSLSIGALSVILAQSAVTESDGHCDLARYAFSMCHLQKVVTPINLSKQICCCLVWTSQGYEVGVRTSEIP